jgi:hypothetical protein
MFLSRAQTHMMQFYIESINLSFMECRDKRELQEPSVIDFDQQYQLSWETRTNKTKQNKF